QGGGTAMKYKDNLLDDQERRWEAGESPRVEDYLVADPSLDPSIIAELVLNEVRLRRQRPEKVVEEYRTRLPQYAEFIEEQLRVAGVFDPEGELDECHSDTIPGQCDSSTGLRSETSTASEQGSSTRSPWNLLRSSHIHEKGSNAPQELGTF